MADKCFEILCHKRVTVAHWALRRGHTIVELKFPYMASFWLFRPNFSSNLVSSTYYRIPMSWNPDISWNIGKSDYFRNSVHMHHFDAVHTVCTTNPLIKKANYLKSTKKYGVVTHLSNILDICRFSGYRLFAAERGGFLSSSVYSPAPFNKNSKKGNSHYLHAQWYSRFEPFFCLKIRKLTNTNQFHMYFKGVRPTLREKNDFALSTSQPNVSGENQKFNLIVRPYNFEIFNRFGDIVTLSHCFVDTVGETNRHREPFQQLWCGHNSCLWYLQEGT